MSFDRAAHGLDDGVGRLLVALEQTDQFDNTLVVFTSDQGFAWGQHGFEWEVAPYDAHPQRHVPVVTALSITHGIISICDALDRLVICHCLR